MEQNKPEYILSNLIIYYKKDTQKFSIYRNFYFLNDPLYVPNDHMCKEKWPGQVSADMCEIVGIKPHKLM
jgi:hypothetical protein